VRRKDLLAAVDKTRTTFDFGTSKAAAKPTIPPIDVPHCKSKCWAM
jgi:hypothetical protein